MALIAGMSRMTKRGSNVFRGLPRPLFPLSGNNTV